MSEVVFSIVVLLAFFVRLKIQFRAKSRLKFYPVNYFLAGLKPSGFWLAVLGASQVVIGPKGVLVVSQNDVMVFCGNIG